tara:strand:- start:546 stop:1142 length:597 start_codon:yes stop_codon:yes gene_type:complete
LTKLILIRHGQSIWNAANRFTGWIDVELSTKGEEEAKEAGINLAEIRIDIVHTSELIRAQKTAEIILEYNKISDPIIKKNSSLNERNYGSLQGLNKKETAEIHGEEQVKIWRRSFNIPPPGGESLEMTAARTIPYFKEEVISDLINGKNVMVSAHGNSLRSIVMYIEKITPEKIVNLEIPTGIPQFYSYEDGVIKRTY